MKMNNVIEKPFVVACIPAYNEEKSIAGVIVKTMRYVNKIIVCDDGSTDLTGEISRHLGATVIQHEKNKGYGAALGSLFSEAKKMAADITITLDGDGQHNPDEIPNMIKKIQEENADLVIGSRFIKDGYSEAPKWRKNGIKIITKMVASNGIQLTDAQSGFRAYSNHALNLISITEDGMGASTEILFKAFENGLKIVEINSEIGYNQNSSTQSTVVHGVSVVLSTLKYISMRRPLLFYGVPGVISLLVAALFWIFTFRSFALTRSISTNVTLVAMAATLVGLMLMTTSIILWVLISIVKENAS